MSKPTKAKDDVLGSEAPEQGVEVSVQVSAVAPARRVSFDQWAAKRAIKESHRRGMRAFIKTPDRVRTIAEWDEAFKAY